MKKIFILLSLLMATMFAPAENYLRTNGTHNNDGSGFFFTTDEERFPITDQTRIVAHIRPYEIPGKPFYGIFGVGSYYLISRNNQWVACTTQNDHTIGAIEYGKDVYIDFRAGHVTIDYEKNATIHKYEEKWDCPAFNLGTTYMRFELGMTPLLNTYYPSLYTYSDIEIYEFSIYEGDKLIRHYVPSIYKENDYDEGYCLYDTKGDCFMMDTNGFPHFSSNIKSCGKHNHKYVKFESSGSSTVAHCCICNEKMGAGEWQIDNELGVTAIEPYFDTEADSLHAGQQKVIMASTNPMYEIMVFNSETNKLEMTLNAEGERNTIIALPRVEKTTKHNIIVRTFETEMIGTQMDTTYLYATAMVTQKPYHQLNNLKVTENHIKDANGNTKQVNNVITFEVSNTDEDILPSDGILVIRATKPDFSDAVNIGSLTMDDHKNRKFTFVDEDVRIGSSDVSSAMVCSKAAYDELNSRFPRSIKAINEFYTYNAPQLYYKIERATASSLWQNNKDKFRTDTAVVQTSMLPPVSGITLKKDRDWEENKTVKLKVELSNPYPWDWSGEYSIWYEDGNGVKAILQQTDTAMVFRKYRWEDNARIKITRYSPADEYYKGEDYAANTLTIKGDEVKWDKDKKCFYAEVEDVQNLPYLHYYYKAEVDGSDCIYCFTDPDAKPACTSKSEADACWSETAVLITSLTADQGTNEGKVSVKWELGAGDKSLLKLVRQTLNNGRGDVRELEIDQDGNSYVDTDVVPGEVYEYHLTSTLEYRGATYQSDKTCNGWVSFYGSIAGKVLLPNGTGLINAKVRITRDKEVVIADAKDKDGKTILEGVTAQGGFTFETTTDQNGYFFADSLIYNADAATYTVTADYGVCSFESNGKVITLSPSRCNYDDVDFLCTTTHKFVGRVLYENSTVPVKGVRFLMNGIELRDRNGNAIETDHDGNFSVVVPTAKITLKATKEGHTFLDEAIKDKNNNTEFTPDQDYSGLIIYDKTRVRVIGRIAGGDIEGKKALGFGMSRNVLGDDITMVLQLEGNNTAQIVYKKDDPDNTEINDTIAHKYGGGATAVSFQKKRIVIKPDVVTGEFYADLFPTKYKVTQISAKGYSTLFASGEGFEVIDFTDSVSAKTDTLNSLTLDYNAKYNRIYHSPVALTYQQYRYGMKVAYYGEDKINERNLLGTKFKATVATADKQGNVTYTFGYPVFLQGQKYTLQVRAHEDYYYNGDTKTIPQEVNIKGGKLHVKNGLNSSETNDEVYELDTLGMRTIVLSAENTNFSLTGEDALKALNMQVELNGYYYSAKPLQAYVIGSRLKGTDALASFDTEKGLIDVIRDPYGASSSAYREAGTTYHWNYEFSNVTEHNLEIHPGVGFGGVTNIGLGIMTETSFKAVVKPDINIPLSAKLNSKNGQYEMTLTDRFSTSSDPLDVGAMADVYLGYGTRTDILTHETVSIIDELTYQMVAEAIKKGAVKLLTSGKDAEGYNYYVVIGDKLGFNRSVSEIFAYSQKHILGTLIPNIEKKRDALLLEGMEVMAQAIANETGKEQYLVTSKKRNEYKMIIPAGQESETFVDRVKEYNNQISAWQTLIYNNEKAKISAQNSTSVQHISVAGTTLNHSEGATQYYIQKTNVSLPIALTGGITGSGGNDGIKNDNGNPEEYKVTAGGLVIDFSLGYQKNITRSEVKNYYKIESMGSGYTISTNDNGYLDLDICNVVADKAIMINDELKDINPSDVNVAKIHDYVYFVRGGAQRNPWYAPDSTLFYSPGTPLGVQTLKIDNPRIYIESPVVSNIPEDETATFKIRLTNDTEISSNTKYLNPSGFILKLMDETNPFGAKLRIDGQPLTSGREFYIAPGESIVKTLEVDHGTGYDYNDIKLMFRDAGCSIFSYATFSVHYLPVATPVKLSAPQDKWVMNTLSASDDNGFFIPVRVDGFDLNSEGFHHIELQYKKRSDGESQYVNLCSFYSDSTLYAAANGTKRMIEGGKIENFKFYGEKDPVEMEYDLRAVSFRQLGTGFISRNSNIMSGKKDTRCPEVFGLPEPSSSILSFDDIPMLNFSEPIAYNYLDKTSNFQVSGYTNETDILQSSTLHFPGTESQLACTSINRNLANRDFTIDMMIKADADRKEAMSLFSHGDDSNFIHFYLGSDNSLNAVVSGVSFSTEPLSLDFSSALTHVGMAYDYESGKVQFFANNSYIGSLTDVKASVKYNNSGKIYLGTFLNDRRAMMFKGEMLEVRLWSKVLSESEIAAYKGKHLTGYERQLIANWPLRETIGNRAQDRAHGADLTLTDLTWNNVAGYSLHIDKAPVKLDAMKMTVNKTMDNSIEFWFKVDNIDETTAAKQGGRVALFKAGNVHLGKGQGKMFVGFENADFIVNTNDSSFVIGSKEGYADAGWHHFAMTVNRATNYAAIYLDSKLVGENEAARVDGIASDYVALGDSAMTGNFDIFAQWDMALPSYYIKDFYNTKLFGTEMGLRNYMPFSYNTTNNQGTQVLEFSIANEIVKRDADGKIVTSKDTLITSTITDTNKDFDNHAPVKESPELQNLDFSWTSTGNALQLNVNEIDSKINKQYIYFTVRGVEDLSGNTMKNPVMWACYVDKNVLRWKEQSLDLECKYRSDTQARIEWCNVSGKRLDYKIDNVPGWLTIDKTIGTATAEKEGAFVISTDKNLAPGKYTETIYLTDENGLSDALTINLTVKAEEAGWKVDKTMYDRTMNLMAKVVCKGFSFVGSNVSEEYMDDDPDDIVGAFINGECVGVANITNDPSLGAYLMMTIYGDSLIARSNPKKNISFLLWKHDSGIIYELENLLADGTTKPVTFVTNSTVGLPPEEPIILKVTDKIEQDIYLDEGWNWVSFNVSPRAVDGINSVFINQAGLFSDDDIIKHVDFAQYSEKYKSWLGTLDKTDYHYVYQIFVKNPGIYKMLGYELPQDSLSVNVKPGWNDMPYLLSESLDINRALADFQIGDKAKTGDIVKSIDEFAVAKEDPETGLGVWVGTLKTLVPGKGYYLKHNGTATSFMYQKDAVNKTFGSRPWLPQTRNLKQETRNKEPYNMPVIATFAADVDCQEGDRLIAIANGQKVGEAECRDGIFFLSVNANDGDVILFAQERDGEIVAQSPCGIKFNQDGVVGSLDSPYKVSFSDIDFSNADVYGTNGIKYSKPTTNNQQPTTGVYIVNGKKVVISRLGDKTNNR